MDYKKLRQVKNVLKPRQTSLPILDNLRIEESNATMTNLATYFIFPVDMAVSPSIIDIDHFISVQGDVKNDLSKLDHQNFPETPILGKRERLITFKGDMLNSLYEMLDFVSNDDLRPAMSAICLSQNEDKMYLVATDAHKMAYKQVKLKKSDQDLLIPSDLVRILKIFKPFQAIFSVHEKYIALSFNDIIVIIRKEESRYPAWAQVILKRNMR